MPGILAIGEVVEGRATRLTLEVASLASRLARVSTGGATVLLVTADRGAAEDVAAHGPDVIMAESPAPEAPAAAGIASVAASLIDERVPDVVLIGSTPDGKDVAGILVGLTDLPILVAASDVGQDDGHGPIVESAVFGGRLITRSVFGAGRGIIIVRPGAAVAEPATVAGTIVTRPADASLVVPAVRVVERVVEPRAGPSIDDARTIVGAGRGIGGPEGLALVEELAAALGGAVGATRAVVDAGWVDFGQQIGQTGKTVRPELYVACGISGAIQHRVGVQSAGTIVAINRDPDAPITEFADLVVVGDLFDIVPRLTRALREARAAG